MNQVMFIAFSGSVLFRSDAHFAAYGVEQAVGNLFWSESYAKKEHHFCKGGFGGYVMS